MDYISIDILDCKPGNVMAEDVFNRYGAIIVAQHTVLNSYIINKLINLGIKRVNICDLKYSSNRLPSDADINQNYTHEVVLTKKIINEIIATDRINLRNLDKLSDSVYQEIEQNFNIMSCINKIRSADEYTYNHCLNVGFYGALMGKWMGLSKEDITNIIKAGFLHDVGKVKVPNEIINKKGKLLPEEYSEIKKHSMYGFNIIKNMENIRTDIKEAVLLHHEREDGSGYPFGHTGSEATLYSKIIAIADVYDAMTSKRVYSEKSTPFKAFEMFTTEGVKLFDPKVTDVFLKRITHYYIGSKVTLNTGETGEVVYIPLHCITSPVVKTDERYIDLSQEENCSITSCYF